VKSEISQVRYFARHGEATGGKGLEVRIDSYTDRQPTERRTNILLN